MSDERTKKHLYTIGLDFGTLSGRALLVDVGDGSVLGESVMDYAHGVMMDRLPSGEPVPRRWALQHPQDYLDVLYHIVPEVIEKSGVDPASVIGVAVDFTGCTMLGVDDAGEPLCFQPQFVNNPLSWVIHWKHHGATSDIAEVQAAIEAHDPEILRRHGGKISDECMMPKVLQIVREAPEIYQAAALFMEAGDWLTMKLTGKLVRGQAMAGYKAFWQKEKGYPKNEFYEMLDERLDHFAEKKLKGELRVIGERAGVLTETMAKQLGLCPGTAVAVAHYDGHTALVGSGISEPGDVLLTLGTSGGFILAYHEKHDVQGTTGVTEDGDLPGIYGYASGQFSLGDSFAWCVNNLIPQRYLEEARQKGVSVQALLTEKAANLAPGESGLLALDWLGGNRSVLVDSQLSCMMLGMTLQTRPEEIYRTFLESVAFGTRRIMEAYECADVRIGDIHAVGGIVKKNPLLMQIYADILNRHICVCKTSQAAALGAAIFAASAAGADAGGYATLDEAIKRMSELEPWGYDPIPQNVEIYQKLYEEFKKLHDYFGCENAVMKRLRQVQRKTDDR